MSKIRVTVNSGKNSNEKLSGIATKLEIEFIDIVGPMAKSAEENSAYYHRFDNDIEGAHYNAAGHREVGRILGSRLCELISRRRL